LVKRFPPVFEVLHTIHVERWLVGGLCVRAACGVMLESGALCTLRYHSSTLSHYPGVPNPIVFSSI